MALKGRETNSSLPNESPPEGAGRSPAEPESAIADRRARAGKNDEYRQRRAALLRVAAELFHTKGLSETSLADIAAAADLDRASVYYYFGNKDEILAEVLGEALTESLKEIERISRSRVLPDEKLRRLIIAGMRLFDKHYPYMYVFARLDMEQVQRLPIAPELKTWLVEQSYKTTRIWHKVIADGIKAGMFETALPVNVAANTLLGALAWSHSWYRPNGDLSAEAVGKGLADLMVDGLRRRGDTPSGR